MQITVSAAQRRVLVLINRGWLVKTQRKARTIRPASISFHGDQLEIMDLYRQKWIRHISGTTKTYAPDQSSW
jgi:cytochrome oxidase assembly protein ShyY1